MSDETERSYRALQHLSPDIVRTMRAALDNGVTAARLRKSISKQKLLLDVRRLVLETLEHLSANPEAGTVTWLKGEQWEFTDRLRRKQ